MKTLLILRHAKSSWKFANLSDHDRPLNNRGRGDAPRMGKLIRDEGLIPELVVSSTAVRARSTALLAAEEWDGDTAVEFTRDFYLADPEEYVHRLQALTDDSLKTVMIVGHNPGMADLVDELTGESVRFPTAALAQIELPILAWAELSLETEGRLLNLWLPKEL